MARRQQPGGGLDVPSGIVDPLAVQRVGHVQPGLAVVGGDDGVGQAVDEGGDTVARIVGVQRDGQDLDVAQAGQAGRRAALLDGALDPRHGGGLVGGVGLAPFAGIAAVELVQQDVEAGEVVADLERDRAVEIGLAELVRRHAFAAGTLAVRRRTACAAGQQRRQQRRDARGYQPSRHALTIRSPTPPSDAWRNARRPVLCAELYRKEGEDGSRRDPEEARR